MSEKICDICHKVDGRYVCPACGVLYCSVDCYKDPQHVQCSELFYKKCVSEELQLRQHESRANDIVGILNRTRANPTNDCLDSDDDDDGGNDNESNNEEEDENDYIETDIEQRMADIDLDDGDEIWEKLTLNERKEFQKLISNGEIRHFLPDWQPWWVLAKKPKIVELDDNSQEETFEDFLQDYVHLKVPPFKELTNKPPAVNIPFMLTSVLMSYAYTARFCKGQHCEMPVEGVTTMFALSPTIRNNKVFDNFLEVMIAFEDDLKICGWAVGKEINSDQIWKDVTDIVKCVKGDDIYFGVKVSLSDVNNLVSKALQELKTSDSVAHVKRFTGPPPTTREIKLLSKKITYYLSWLEPYGKQLLDALTKQLLISPVE